MKKKECTICTAIVYEFLCPNCKLCNLKKK